MALKTIIVHVGDDAQVENRIRVAANLAARHGAFLTGLFVMRDVGMPGAIHGRGASPVVLESRLERLAERANELAGLFAEACDTQGVGHRWVQEDGEHSELLAIHARAADLLIVSQFESGGLDNKLRLHIAERLILTAGVPVLVVPRDYGGELRFDTVMLAWKSSRESVRAIRDTIDIAKTAKRVIVLGVGNDSADERIPLGQVQSYLARHGITAEIERDFGDTRNAGDILLRQAQDHQADVLIMGAFGRPGWFEIILGGATRQVLEHTDVPVIMSH